MSANLSTRRLLLPAVVTSSTGRRSAPPLLAEQNSDKFSNCILTRCVQPTYNTMPNKDQQSPMRKEFDHRFQRTEQWKPVYAWLESLDTIELIKSDDVLNWLSENPEISEKLHSKHARHHLLHYIKICHAKILKRKGLIVRKMDQRKGSLHCNGANLSSISKDSELYKAKQSEALLKYEILVGLEKQLTPLFGKHR